VGADVTAEGEDAGEVYLEDSLPVFVGELMGGVSSLDSAAVQQDVDLVAVFEDCGDEGGDGVVGGQVTCVDLGFAVELLDGFFCGLVGGVALGRLDQWFCCFENWKRRT